MEVHDDASVAALQLLLFVSFAQEGQRRAVRAEGRLDDIRNHLLTRGRVQVFHALAAVFRMSFKVIIGAACNAPEFTPTERETIFDIGCAVGIVAKLFG